MLQPLYQHLPVDGQSLRPVQGRQCPEDQLRVSGSIEGLQCIFCTAKVVLLLQLLHSLVKGQQPAASAEPVAQPRYLIAQLCLRKLIIRFEQFPEAGKKRLLLHKKQKIRTERYDALCAEGKSLLYSLQYAAAVLAVRAALL